MPKSIKKTKAAPQGALAVSPKRRRGRPNAVDPLRIKATFIVTQAQKEALEQYNLDSAWFRSVLEKELDIILSTR